MNPRDLLDLAETRLLALDEEPRTRGTFTEKLDTALALVELAEARARYELVRLQTIELDQRIRRTGTADQYRDFELDRS